MTQLEFIKQIAAYVQKYAPKYGINVYSPIIAQACLESAYGTSNKAKYNNFFGLKYRKNRVSCNNGYFEDGGSEQNVNGTYTPLPSSTAWYSFDTMEQGVEGYFQFINIDNYKNLKGVSDPLTYLKNIKSDGYATSLSYVENVYSVIKKWDLTKYDSVVKTESEGVNMSNSSYVTYTNLTSHNSGNRTHSIDRITPHCIVGQWSAKTGCDYFRNTDRQCSANYVLGTGGISDVGLSVPENKRAWTSSSNANDQRAVTIECASDTSAPFAMNSKVYNGLILLMADICKRNGKTKILWFSDKNTRVNYAPKSNEMVITCHRDFASTACPGDWLYSRLGDVAKEVQKILDGGSVSAVTPSSTTSTTQSVSSAKLSVDGDWGRLTTKRAQKVFGTIQDGEVSGQCKADKSAVPNANTSSWVFNNGSGSNLIRAIQKAVGATADGYCGKNTVTKMQAFLNKKGLYKQAIDGIMGAYTVKAFQEYLNKQN